VFATAALLLDVPFFAFRAALHETGALLNGTADARAAGPRPLCQLHWLLARHRYLRRAIDRAAAFRQSPSPDGVTAARCADPYEDDVVHMVEKSVRRVEALTRTHVFALWRLRARLRLGEERWVEPWNLNYYAACVLGALISEVPEDADFDPSRFIETAWPRRSAVGQAKYESWWQHSDDIAFLAVQHLQKVTVAHALSWTVQETTGVREWIVMEDPDLHRLRRHPRFRRWAQGSTDIQVTDTSTSQGLVALHQWADRQAFHEDDRAFARQNGFGTMGLSLPHDTHYREWRLVHSDFLTSSLEVLIPAACAALTSLAREIAGDADAARSATQPAPGVFGDGRAMLGHPPTPAGVLVVAQHLHRFWSQVEVYCLAGPDPKLRLSMGDALRRVALLRRGALPVFPTAPDAIASAQPLDLARLASQEADAVARSLARIERLQHTATQAWTPARRTMTARLLGATADDLRHGITWLQTYRVLPLAEGSWEV
jgi:hypothetical protein